LIFKLINQHQETFQWKWEFGVQPFLASESSHRFATVAVQLGWHPLKDSKCMSKIKKTISKSN